MQLNSRFKKAYRNKRPQSNKIMHWKTVRISEDSSHQVELKQCFFSYFVKDMGWIFFVFPSRCSFPILFPRHTPCTARPSPLVHYPPKLSVSLWSPPSPPPVTAAIIYPRAQDPNQELAICGSSCSFLSPSSSAWLPFNIPNLTTLLSSSAAASAQVNIASCRDCGHRHWTGPQFFFCGFPI